MLADGLGEGDAEIVVDSGSLLDGTDAEALTLGDGLGDADCDPDGSADGEKLVDGELLGVGTGSGAGLDSSQGSHDHQPDSGCTLLVSCIGAGVVAVVTGRTGGMLVAVGTPVLAVGLGVAGVVFVPSSEGDAAGTVPTYCGVVN